MGQEAFSYLQTSAARALEKPVTYNRLLATDNFGAGLKPLPGEETTGETSGFRKHGVRILSGAVLGAVVLTGTAAVLENLYSSHSLLAGPNILVDPQHQVMTDPNLVGIADPASGACVLAWFDKELLGQVHDKKTEGPIEVLTYNRIKGRTAIPGDFGAKQKFSVRPDEVRLAEDFLSYVGEEKNGDIVYLNLPQGCVPGGEPNITRFKKIRSWAEPEEKASVVMPEDGEGNWDGTSMGGGMIRVYPKGYKPITP